MSPPSWLSTLTQLRRQERDESRRRLDEALEAALDAAQKDQALASEAEHAKQLRRSAAASGACDLNLLLAAQRHQAALEMERRSVAQQSELLQQEVERRRAALAKADQQLRILDRLSERKAQQARREAALRETKRLDDVATVLFDRERDT